MASSSSIAKKARRKAETDFATWLMMAKLGSFDNLPSNAQQFLTDYRARLEMMSEAESTVLAIREVYNAYYSEIGRRGRGTGTASTQTNDRGQSRAVSEAGETPASSVDRARCGRARRPEIRIGFPDFCRHGGFDRRLQVSSALSRPPGDCRLSLGRHFCCDVALCCPSWNPDHKMLGGRRTTP